MIIPKTGHITIVATLACQFEVITSKTKRTILHFLDEALKIK